MKKKLFAFLICGTVVLGLVPANAQIDNPPVGIAVKIYAKGTAATVPADLTVSGTYLPSTPTANDAYQTKTATATAYGSTLVAVLGAQDYVRVESGKSYSVTVNGPNVTSGELNIVAPAGYRVILDHMERSREMFSGVLNAVFEVQSLGARHPGLAGMASGTPAGEIDWRVSLGSLRNGGSAGDLALIDNGMQASWSPIFTPARLYYEATSDEVWVYRPNNTIRQIRANQVVVDIVTLSPTSYEIRCYHPAQERTGQVANSDESIFVGQAFATYRIEQNGTGCALRITKEIRDIVDFVATNHPVARREFLTVSCSGTWPALNWTKTDWTLEGQSPLTETVVESAAATGTLDRRDTFGLLHNLTRTESTKVRVPNPGGSPNTPVFRADRTYSTPLTGSTTVVGEVMAIESVGSAAGNSSDFEYHADPTKFGSLGYLKWAKLPGGNWVAYDYYDSNLAAGFRGGRVKYRYRPFLDAPALVSMNSALGEVTYHEYVDDVFGAPVRPSLVQTSVNNVVVAKTTTSYYDNHYTVNGHGLARSVRNEYTSYTGSLQTTVIYYREDVSDAFLRGQTHSITYPGNRKVSFAYQRGTLDGTTFTAAGSGAGSGGNATRIVSISGTTSGGSAWSSADGYVMDVVYLVAGKSTMEATIRDSRALVVRTESKIWTGSTFQLVGFTDYFYDVAGRLLRRVGSNGATYSAVYVGGFKSSETDEAGVTTNFSYDAHGRVALATRLGSGAIAELATKFTYDAAGRVTKEEVGFGKPEVVATQRSYDDAGRTTSVAPPGNYGATTYSYDLPARTQTATRAEGSTIITTNYRDGRTYSTTGTGTVHAFHTYGIGEGGIRWHQLNVGAANSPRWKKTCQDWLGREIKSEHPGYTGQDNVVAENTWAATTGYLSKTTKTGYAPTLYQYDLLGRVSTTALDYNQNGVIDVAGNDRITQTDTALESFEGAWWMRTVVGNATKLGLYSYTVTSISRTRLTGHGPNRLSETVAVDAEGNITRQWVDVNRNARTSTATTTRTGLAGTLVEQTVNGFSTSVTSFDGLTVTKAYDSLLRPSTVTDSRGNTTTTTYVTGTALGQTVTNAAGNQVVTTYNTLGQVVTQRDARNHRTRFAYNLRGQLTQQWGDGAMPVEYGYDATYGDRVSMKTYRGGTGWDTTAGDGSNTSNPWPASPGTADTTTWTYDASSGLLTGKTDALGRTAGQTYNLRGQTAVRTLARGVTTTFGYDDATGELLSQTYSDGTPAVSFTYGRTGQVETITDTTGTRDLVYDPAKPWRLTAEAHADFYGSRVLTRLYDETGTIGRVRGFQLGATAGSNSDLEQTFGFTTVGRFETLTSNRLGNTAAARTFRYSYLANTALLQRLAIDQGAGPGGHPFTITRTYESQRDLVLSLDSKWSTDLRTGYSYVSDERGLRTKVVQSGSVFADYGDVTAQQFTYNGRGELTGAIGYLGSDITLPAKQLPGRRHEYAYDPAGNRQWSNRTGVTALRDDYTTNALNQYVSRENNTVPVSGTAEPDTGGPGGVAVAVAGGATTPVPAGRQGRYWNDEVAVTNAAGPWRGPLAIYAVKRSTGNGDLFKVESRMAEIAAVLQSFAYDLDGNLTSDGLVDYTWDAENRLVRMETSLAARGAGFPHRELTFRYDYLGRRVQKRVVDVTQSQELSCRRFLYDGWNLIAEYAAPGGTTCGTLLRSYTWGLDIVNTLSSAGGVGALLQIADHPTGKTFLPTYDGNGNVVALVNATSGAVAAAYEYSPFGEPLRAQTVDPVVADNPFRFSTKYTDGETGLVYYGHRYYDPRNGRFINRDPIEETGGLNLYGFCGNDGVNRWDYLGMAEGGQAYSSADCPAGYVLINGVVVDPDDDDAVNAALAGVSLAPSLGISSSAGSGSFLNFDTGTVGVIGSATLTFSGNTGSFAGNDLSLGSISTSSGWTATDSNGGTLLNAGTGSLTFFGSDPTFCGPVASATTGNTVTLILGTADWGGPISTSGAVNSSSISTVDAGTTTAPPSVGAGAPDNGSNLSAPSPSGSNATGNLQKDLQNEFLKTVMPDVSKTFSDYANRNYGGDYTKMASDLADGKIKFATSNVFIASADASVRNGLGYGYGVQSQSTGTMDTFLKIGPSGLYLNVSVTGTNTIKLYPVVFAPLQWAGVTVLKNGIDFQFTVPVPPPQNSSPPSPPR
jgi:RHS repeat-associated protein